MIDKKFLELIHKDIDKEITPPEKEMLGKYLKQNPEAEELHRELIEAEKLLDKLPEPEPSENLKKRILNSLDLNRYAPNKKDNLFRVFAPRHKPRYAFSLVVVVGIILIGLFISNPNLITSFDQEEISGTMGIYSAKQIVALNVKNDDLNGLIEVFKGSDPEGSDLYRFGFSVKLSAADNYQLNIEYDPSYVTLKDIFSENESKFTTISRDGAVQISSVGDSFFSVLFSSEVDAAYFNLMVSRQEINIYEKQVFVK
jgi:hypothetical protein